MYDRRLTPGGYRVNLMKWLGSNLSFHLVKEAIIGWGIRKQEWGERENSETGKGRSSDFEM
jgi:hypothetical protein